MRCFITDLRKTIINAGFFGAAVLICFLCFMTEIGTSEEPSTVLQAIFTWDNQKKLSEVYYSSYMIFRKGMSTYVRLFIPLIVAFPFIASYCNERKSGLVRFTISRVGWLKYMVSKFCASLLSGGLSCLLGYLIFGVIISFIFYPMSRYDVDPYFMQMIFSKGISYDFFLVVISVFAFGAVSVIPAFLISSICRNQYVITCLPVMLVYIWSIVLNKIERFYMEEGNYTIYDHTQPFRADSLLALSSLNEKSIMFKRIIEVNSIYVLFGLLIFMAAMHAHKDRGW